TPFFPPTMYLVLCFQEHAFAKAAIYRRLGNLIISFRVAEDVLVNDTTSDPFYVDTVAFLSKVRILFLKDRLSAEDFDCEVVPSYIALCICASSAISPVVVPAAFF